jgi:hypothetical protein
MTRHDPELLELLAERPDLLAIADAVAATQEPPRTPVVRRRTTRLLAVAVVAAAAVVVASLLPEGKHGIVERAAAAIGDGRILHIVAEVPSGTVDVDLQSGRRTEDRYRVEFWADQKLDHLHAVMTVEGQVVVDLLWPQDAAGGATVGPVDPAFAALWSGYREALEDGSATRAGEGDVFGHHVYWLRFATVDKSPGSEIAVDAETYKPIVWRTYNGLEHTDQHIVLAETTDLASANFTRIGPDPAGLDGGLTVSSGGGSMSYDGASPTTIVPHGWLSAGPDVAGKKLSGVLPQTITTSDKKTVDGIQLVYGTLNHGFASSEAITVDELPQPDDPSVWANIPAGSVEIQQGQTSGSGGDHLQWTGYVTKHGRYVTITAQSEQTVVDVARALEPVK